jgi:hypothetical protein
MRLMLSVVLSFGAIVAIADSQGGEDKKEGESMEARPLTLSQHAVLNAKNWPKRVGGSTGVWVSVSEQKVRLVQDGKIRWEVPCSTAKAGVGSQAGSNKTPLGWHSVKKKFGEGAPLGQVFRSRQKTNEVWKPGDETDEDLVLTRILWLTGEEPGINQGGNVDSYLRYIYFHGTNEEHLIGQPASHGCIRLYNKDAVKAYELIPLQTKVLITE